MFEIEVTKCAIDIIDGLISNGYVIEITPTKYSDGHESLIITIKGKDESYDE